MRRAARVDGNHAAIVEALQKAGWLVQSLAAVGNGVPDLLVCSPSGDIRLIEVKDGSKPPSKRELTTEQLAWHWRWQRARVRVVTSAEDALTQLGVQTR